MFRPTVDLLKIFCSYIYTVPPKKTFYMVIGMRMYISKEKSAGENDRRFMLRQM